MTEGDAMIWWMWVLIVVYIVGLLAVLFTVNRPRGGLIFDAVFWPFYLIACVCD